MLRVLSAANNREVTLLAMLDLTAAFDCVDHSILLQRLQQNFGLTDVGLRWLTSFLSGQAQQMICSGRLSEIQRVWYGVPQGLFYRPSDLHHLYRWN